MKRAFLIVVFVIVVCNDDTVVGGGSDSAIPTDGGGSHPDMTTTIDMVPSIDSSAAPTFAADIKPIFMKYGCASHHAGMTPSGGLDLTMAPTSLIAMAGECKAKQYVTPGDITKSYLLDKLQGAPMVAGCGMGTKQMPLSGPPYLTAPEVLTVQNWIAAGAM